MDSSYLSCTKEKRKRLSLSPQKIIPIYFLDDIMDTKLQQ